MKKTTFKKATTFKFLFLSLVLLGLSSCGGGTLDNLKDAKEFLNTHKFSDSEATVKGRNDDNGMTTAFSMSFKDNKAIIGDETLEYTIMSTPDGSPNFNGPGFILKICGSERYAYGGCINGYLSSGRKGEISLHILGDYINAWFLENNGSIESK